jgi:23S rRNA (guanosine2251-2'-O)-methyltransferase
MLVYGINAVTEALKARKVERLIAVRGAGDRVTALLDRARELRVPVEIVDKMAIERLTRGGVHQNIAAQMAALPAYTLDEILEVPKSEDRAPLLVVLDGIEDPHNVGAIIRTADAAGVDGIIRQGRHAAPLGGAVAKASAGAVSRVRIATVVNIARALQELKEAGVWTVGLDGGANERYDQVDYTIPTAFVFGAEGSGLRRLVGERCDRLVGIPMSGEAESLNVSVAAGITLFEAVRQRLA